MTVYAKPGTEGSVMSFEGRYENWIGGKWCRRSRASTSRIRRPSTAR